MWNFFQNDDDHEPPEGIEVLVSSSRVRTVRRIYIGYKAIYKGLCP